jgi:sRNA-binding carbon storage regulator CsrA
LHLQSCIKKQESGDLLNLTIKGEALMLVLKGKAPEKRLLLGDYVAVHVSTVKKSQSHIGHGDVLVQHEDFFQRILKDRRELREVQHRKAA